MSYEPEPTQFRLNFLRLAEKIQRELCSPSFPLHFECDPSIALALTLAGTNVEITHSLTSDPASVCIDTQLEALPSGAIDVFEARALCANHELFRALQASLGVEADGRTLFCSQRKPLASLTAADLLGCAKALAGPLRLWARTALPDACSREAPVLPVSMESVLQTIAVDLRRA